MVIVDVCGKYKDVLKSHYNRVLTNDPFSCEAVILLIFRVLGQLSLQCYD